MKEHYYDKLLHIKTGGIQKDFNMSIHYHPYEPTPYHALETLFQSYELKSSDHLVDFGCGKGRLNFYIHYYFDTFVTGVEMNKNFFKLAVENQNHYLGETKYLDDKLHFHCCLAENYEINPADNRFYFFNPFSIKVFMKVINNILFSVEKSQRNIELILYYPSEDYIFYLENQTIFQLKEEIVLPEFIDHNPNERFLIYQLQ